MSNKIVVTRHKGLYRYLVEEGIVPKGTECRPKVDKEDIVGKHVYGILPLWLACKADKYTEVQLRIPHAMKSKELSVEDVRFLTYAIRTYKVEELEEHRRGKNKRK